MQFTLASSGQPAPIDTMVHEPVHHRCGTRFRKLLIEGSTAYVVRIAFHLDLPVWIILKRLDDFRKRSLCVGGDIRLASGKMDLPVTEYGPAAAAEGLRDLIGLPR